MSEAREAILATVRSALGADAKDPAASYAEVRRHYRRSAPELDHQATVDLLLDRLRDYDAVIIEAPTEAAIPAAITAALELHHETRIVVPAGLPAAFIPANALVESPDNALPIATLSTIQAVITTCETAVAETGTIILAHGPAEGRRILTLLPDHHICILRRPQIVATLAEALALPSLRDGRPLTTISGPSATSDIEMVRIRGVHGPRHLTVVLAP